MKVIAYSHNSAPLNIKQGESNTINLKIDADGSTDLSIAYVVLMGYDDIDHQVTEFDLPARVIQHLQEENEHLRKRVGELRDMEKIALAQGEELERLRTE